MGTTGHPHDLVLSHGNSIQKGWQAQACGGPQSSQQACCEANSSGGTSISPSQQGTSSHLEVNYGHVEWLPLNPLAEEDRHLTTFLTPWGRLRYRVLPQGYLAAGDAYTHRYDQVTRDFPIHLRVLWMIVSPGPTVLKTCSSSSAST